MNRPLQRPRLAALLAIATLAVSACSTPDTSQEPRATAGPTTVPTAEPAAASTVVERYVSAWAAGDYAAMYQLVAPSVRERYPEETFVTLHAQLADLAQTTALTGDIGDPSFVALPPEPRPPDLPAPTPLATPTGPPEASPGASGTPSPSTPPADVDLPIEGPVLAMQVPVDVTLVTERFGEQILEREVVLAQGADGWQLRWSPSVVFPELGDAGELALERQLATRGRILAADDTVLAETRDDGVRIYPQESLAGQTVGYVSEVTAEDLERLAGEGYQAGDIVGRSGLEAGAESLLRGTPGYTLSAVPSGADPVPLFQSEPVPGADVHTALRPDIQRTAEASLAPYAVASTAVIDPATGDVWALASSPPLNPNIFTLGTTLSGIELPEPGFAQIMNGAASGQYPAGSTFKPFTLAAALATGVVTPESPVTCPATWEFEGFTFQNYEEHELPGEVTLADAMAFSCNTTYMPLSIEVFNEDPEALPRIVGEFGFGERTGIQHLSDEAGILPNAEYFAAAEGRDYGPFDQVQLAIGQGSFLGTPLQLANAFAAIGNGGTLWTPRLVTEAVLPDGTAVVAYEPEARRQVSVDPAQLAYVVDTLQAVVDLPFGTANFAFSEFDVAVAGKSGTAETSSEAPDSWFAGIGPADEPTIAVATILVEEPLTTGGVDAAPLVRDVMETHFAP